MSKEPMVSDYRPLTEFYKTKDADLLSVLTTSEKTTPLFSDYLLSLTPTEQVDLLCDEEGHFAQRLCDALETIFTFDEMFLNPLWIPLWQSLSHLAKNKLMFTRSKDNELFLKKLTYRLNSFYDSNFFVLFFDNLPESCQSTLCADEDFCQHMIIQLYTMPPDGFASVWPRLSMRVKQSLIQLTWEKNSKIGYSFHGVVNKFSNQLTNQPAQQLLYTLYEEPGRFAQGMLARFDTDWTIAHEVGAFLENNTIQILWSGLTTELQTVLSKQAMYPHNKPVIRSIQEKSRPSDFKRIWEQLDEKTKLTAQPSTNFKSLVIPKHKLKPSATPSIIPLMSMDELNKKRFEHSVCLIDWDTLVAIDVNSPELSTFALRGGQKTIAALRRLKNDGVSLVLLVNHQLELAKRFVKLLKQSDDQYHFSNVRRPFLSLIDAMIYQKPHGDKRSMIDAFVQNNVESETQHFLIDEDEMICEYAKTRQIMPFKLIPMIQQSVLMQDETLLNAIDEIISDENIAKRKLQLAPCLLKGVISFEAVSSIVMTGMLYRTYLSLAMSIGMSVAVLIALTIVIGLSYRRFMTNQHKIISLAHHRDGFFNLKNTSESLISCDENNVSPSVSFGSLSDLP